MDCCRNVEEFFLQIKMQAATEINVMNTGISIDAFTWMDNECDG